MKHLVLNRLSIFSVAWQGRRHWPTRLQQMLGRGGAPYALDRGPYFLGTVALVLLVMTLALGLGYVCAMFPPAFTSKLSVLLLGGVLLIWAGVVAQAGDSPHAGRITRIGINVWVFLLGALPTYMPFKFGPLPGLHPLRVTYALVMISGVYGLITSAQLRRQLLQAVVASKLVVTLLAGLLLWQCFCAFIGDAPVFSIYYILKVLLPAYVMFVVALIAYRDWRDVQRTALWLLAGALLTCVVGLYEWRTHSNPFLRFLPSDPDEAASLAWILADKARGGDYRISATFAHPLLLAEYLCMALPLALMLAVRAPQRWVRVLTLTSLPLLLGIVYLSYTRSALIAAVASMLVMGALFGVRAARDRQRPAMAMLGWMMVVSAVCAMVALSGTLAYLAKGRTEAEAGSSQARVLMVERGQTLLAERPIQGYGPGLGAVKVGRIQPGQRSVTIDSYFLSIVIENGYVGLAMFVIGMGAVLWSTISAAVRETGVASWALIALAAAIMASLIVKTVLSLTENLDLLYLLCGVAAIAATWAKKAQTRPVQTPVHGMTKLVGG